MQSNSLPKCVCMCVIFTSECPAVSSVCMWWRPQSGQCPSPLYCTLHTGLGILDTRWTRTCKLRFCLLFSLCARFVRLYASPSLSEDSCVGSGVVLLLSVFWLQLDGWLLAFLCFPFTSAYEEAQDTQMKVVETALQTNRPQAGRFNTPIFRKCFGF